TVIPAKAGIQPPTQQESIGKNRNPQTVIPAKAGIQPPLTQQEFIEKTETSKPSFPRKWESSNRKTTGIYRKKPQPPKKPGGYRTILPNPDL
ncbi:TPA: hypothetical protein ACJJB6_002216, partial [Neisseria meningitidis]|uniref:hypothetical protein n=4 Tax=Neisseria meningitidis TaxID=487 RepID=UPI001C57B1F8